MLRALTALLTLLPAAGALAHSDPFGEIHPVVFTDENGNFRIFFDHVESGLRQPMSMLLAQDGRELIPRHSLSSAALAALGIQSARDGDGFDYGSPWRGFRKSGCQIFFCPQERILND